MAKRLVAIDEEEPIVKKRLVLVGPDPDNVSDEEITPLSLRARVGAFEKPEDRLATIRKVYPDAEPTDADASNFIFTNPETGRTHRYNVEGWVPSIGDIASIGPEVAEGTGALLGGLFGGAVGSPSGPGAIATGVAGAAVGGTAAKEAAQQTIRYLGGDEDTRTTEEYLWDKGKDALVSGLGEGAGRLLAPAARWADDVTGNVVGDAISKTGKVLADPIKSMRIGKVPDKETARALLGDFEDIGLKPTMGVITKKPSLLAKEAAIASNPNSKVALAGRELDTGVETEFNRIRGLLSPTEGTPFSVGEALQEQARAAKDATKQRVAGMFDRTQELTGDALVPGTNMRETLLEQNQTLKGMNNTDKLNKGPLLKDAIKQTKAITEDVKKGMTFKQLQNARTELGRLAFGRDTHPYLAQQYRRAYDAATKDLDEVARLSGDEAFDAFKAGNREYAGMFAPDGVNSVLNPVLKKPPEDVYKFVTAKAKEGPTRLNQYRNLVLKEGGEDAWKQMQRAHIEGLGIRTIDGADTFDPKALIKNWNQMAPEAKDAMFKGTSNETLRGDLDRLSRVIGARESAKRSQRELAAKSSDPVTNVFGLLSTAPKAIRGVDRWYMSNLMTDPYWVRWAADLPRAQMQKGGVAKVVEKLREYGVRAGVTSAKNAAIHQFLKDSGLE